MIGLLGSMMGARGGRMLGGMIGGRTGAMVGGMIGSLIASRQLGRLARSVTSGTGEKASGLIGGADGGQAEPLTDGEAELLVMMMCNAAKADGQVDAEEANRIAGELGDDLSAEDRDFLAAHLRSPFRPIDELAATIPSTMASEAYAVSLMAIDVDTAAENQYLSELASALQLSADDVADIHHDLGIG